MQATKACNIEALRSALDSVDVAGSFAYSTYSESPCNPGLIVEKYGSIGLPLSSKDARGNYQLFLPSRPVGFELSQTYAYTFSAGLLGFFATNHQSDGIEVLSSAGRSIGLLLESSKVAWDNPALSVHVDDLVNTATHNLGVACRTNINFRGLRPIGVEDPTPILQTDDRFIGTLLITLPSVHERGTLSVTPIDRLKAFETAPGKYGASYIAYYTSIVV